MTSNLSQRPSNDSVSITLRPALPEDEAFLCAVYASTRRDELAACGWDQAQQEAFLQMQFNCQRQSYGWQYPRAEHQVILRDGQPVGRIIVHRTEEEILLVDIALLPEHRNAGIGGALVRDLFAEASTAGKPVRLHVERFNRARQLYERLGFVCIGDTGMHFLMEWRTGG